MKISKEQIQKLQSFMTWFEDNFGTEDWLDPDADPENEPDGVWRSYMDLPEYVAAYDVIEELEKQNE